MSNFIKEENLSLTDKLKLLNWGIVFVVLIMGLLGIALLYSAGGKNWYPWALPQLIRFGAGMCLMIGIALTDIKVWLRIAVPFYWIVLVLLIAVEIMGHIGMGAQRWINLGFLVIQPSELMKIALILMLSKYFHELSLNEIANPFKLLPPTIIALVPAALVLLQPNLGTALILLAVSGAIFFAAGVKWWKFVILFLVIFCALPIAWTKLHDYQKARIATFLDPDKDPLGHGYNILQSKIAMGSGGLTGRGFGQGTQSQLQFLPEKHTDFIFVVLSENSEW